MAPTLGPQDRGLQAEKFPGGTACPSKRAGDQLQACQAPANLSQSAPCVPRDAMETGGRANAERGPPAVQCEPRLFPQLSLGYFPIGSAGLRVGGRGEGVPEESHFRPVHRTGSSEPLSMPVSSGRLRVVMEMGWRPPKCPDAEAWWMLRPGDLPTNLGLFPAASVPSGQRGHPIKGVGSPVQLDGRAKPLTSGPCVGRAISQSRPPLLFPRLAGCYGDAEASSTRPGKLVRSLGASVPPSSRLRPRRGEAEGVGRGSSPSHRWVGS